MPLILGTNSIKDTGYNVANSLRFNDDSSDRLTRSQSNGNQDKWTWSVWLKRSTLGSAQCFFASTDGSATSFDAKFDSSDRIEVYNYFGGGFDSKLVTNRVFRDVSAWYHIVIVYDSGNSTEAFRLRIYVNGTEESSFSTTNYPSLNADSDLNVSGSNIEIGRQANGGQYFDGYMAEIVLTDGQALDPTSFGEFDEDSPTIWKPKDVSGLTFGTNGFYLDFENSGALGTDVSGNSNNFTVNNLTSIDQSTDTCTNNFCTWNPLDNYIGGATFSEGNVKVQTATNKRTGPSTTIGMTSGKYYCEIKCTAQSAHSSGSPQDAMMIGIRSTDDTATTEELGHHQHDWAMYANGDGTNGQYRNNDGLTNYGVTFTTGDIIGVYVDLDNNKLYFAKNGTIMQSGTGISITDPASTPRGAYFFSAANWSSTTNATFEANFGGTQSFTVSSGNTDANGYGNFEYDPSSGTFDGASKNFYALNTKNLAEFG